MADEERLTSPCDPPETVRTLSDWMAWRRREDERLIAQAVAEIEIKIRAVFACARGDGDPRH
jgi:hypothetical protein